MTYNFVTIFNSLYMPQALSLHSSLKKFPISFKLWAICIDNESYQFINKLSEIFKTIIDFFEDFLRKISFKISSISDLL